jgi:hypothetical protein
MSNLQVQYIDYAYCGRLREQHRLLDSSKSLWLYCCSIHSTLTLDQPLDKPRPNELSFTGIQCQQPMRASSHAQMAKYANGQSCTIFSALTSVFMILLGRRSAQHSLCVGVPYHGKDQAQLDNLCGYFINMLAQFSDYDHRYRLSDLLQLSISKMEQSI